MQRATTHVPGCCCAVWYSAAAVLSSPWAYALSRLRNTRLEEAKAADMDPARQC